MPVEIRQLKDRETEEFFVPVTHWDAVSNKPNIDNLPPIGSITMWPLSSPPSGWLICNGQSIETGDQYAQLRTVLGANNVPDLTGKFPLGVSSSHAIGTTGGEEEHTLSISEMPSHSHTVSKGYHYGGSSELSADVTINTYNLNSRNVRQSTADALTPEDLNPVNYVDLNGSGLAHNNMPPYFTLNFIIKYA